MPLPSVLKQTPSSVLLCGTIAFALLAMRFSPNWLAFADFVREVSVDAVDARSAAAIEQATLSGFSERGLHVVRQTRDLEAEIADPNHKIVRWRLLMPAIGHFLNLSGWATLGLAHLGCLAWIVALVAVGRTRIAATNRPAFEALCLALVAGASTPFFASMGLLGYYDSWLVLGLLAVAFGSGRWSVVLATLLAPWVDERFVIGLPLALLVRWLQKANDPRDWRHWLKVEAVLPLALAGGYVLVRLRLGGTGSSQTVGEYLRQFVFTPRISIADRLDGAWSGLRIGWLLVVAAVVLAGVTATSHRFFRAVLLATTIAVTGLAGLFTALDLSRSMALLTPVVPLGWILASRFKIWQRFHLAAILAGAALLVPAYQVMGRFRLEVDHVWTPSLPLMTAQNNVGLMYDQGGSVPRDVTKAVRWYMRAAAVGHAEAQNNLAAKHIKGEGVPKDDRLALELLHQAAKQDSLSAIYNLGYVHAEGRGVAKNLEEAARWYRKAAERGFANAQNNLGAMYLDGIGVPRDVAEAIKWYTRAAHQGMATAAANLGVIFLDGNAVPADLGTAYHWFLIGAALGDAKARDQVAALEQRLPPAQLAAGRQRAQQTVLSLQKKS